MQKGFGLPLILVGVFIIILIAGGAFYLSRITGNSGSIVSSPIPSPTPDQVACTMEAKLCPDGTSVGRVGPKCEFAPCPKDNGTSNIYKGNGYSINYPSGFVEKENKTAGWVMFSSDDQVVLIHHQATRETDPCKLKLDGYPKSTCINLNGIKMLDWQSEAGNSGPLMFTYSAINSGVLYEISFTDVDKQTKDQILSTFKFTD